MENKPNSASVRSTQDPHPPSEEEVTAHVKRLRENGREAGTSDSELRDKARAELEHERRQTGKALRGEPSPPTSTPEE